jgi:murein L,D-transpeptidase YcbB/YkuD
MHGGEETHVKLKAPIPIHIQYFTAWVDANGGVQFRDDVYGFDARQAAVESRRRPARRNL